MIEVVRLSQVEGAFTVHRDSASPAPLGPEEVRIEVEGASICGPELARAAGRGRPAPGVAVVGVVAEAGAGAEHLVGVRVVGVPVMPCGDCDRCRRGLPELCPRGAPVGEAGGEALSSHVVARARWLCPLEPPIAVAGPEAALLGREAALAYALYARANLAPGGRAVVLGGGAVARLCLDVLRAQGISALSVETGDERWSEIARAAGAGLLPAPEGADLGPLRQALRAAAPEGSIGETPDAVLETTGEAAWRALALELARPGAVAVLAGRGVVDAGGGAEHGEPTPIDEAVDAGVTVLGVAGAHPDLVPEVAALAARGELDLASAAEAAPIAEIAELAQRLARGELPGKAGVAVWS